MSIMEEKAKAAGEDLAATMKRVSLIDGLLEAQKAQEQASLARAAT